MHTREYIAFWDTSSGEDGSKTFDGNTALNGDEPGEILFNDLLGIPAMIFYTPVNWTRQDYYNFVDLNAVESNTNTIATLLSDFTGQTVALTVITNRDKTRFEFYDSINRVESNIKTLSDYFFQPNGWQPPKLTWESGHKFDWRDANRLEQNLYLLYELLLKAFESVKYCGTFYANEDGDIY